MISETQIRPVVFFSNNKRSGMNQRRKDPSKPSFPHSFFIVDPQGIILSRPVRGDIYFSLLHSERNSRKQVCNKVRIHKARQGFWQNWEKFSRNFPVWIRHDFNNNGDVFRMLAYILGKKSFHFTHLADKKHFYWVSMLPETLRVFDQTMLREWSISVSVSIQSSWSIPAFLLHRIHPKYNFSWRNRQ